MNAKNDPVETPKPKGQEAKSDKEKKSPSVGGIKTDEGGRPMTDKGGRPLNISESDNEPS